MKFDELYLELVDSTGMIRSLLSGINREEARMKPAPDSWSILETLCHLYDEEREDFREHLDFILHRPDGTWHRIEPERWVVERKYNAQDIEEVKEKFFGERGKSLDWLKGLEGADWKRSYAAPYGNITAGEMLVSWIAHDNLAVRQLVELRRARLEVITKPYSMAYAGDW